MTVRLGQWRRRVWFLGVVMLLAGAAVPAVTEAANIIEYSDRISDSAPSAPANHTLGFTIGVDLSPGSQIEVTPPPGFTTLATSTFAERNVELRVNGSARTAAATAAPGVDQVDITPGSPGLIRYTLAPDGSISSGDRLELRIGNHTLGALQPQTTFSTSTGTTTTPGDVEPIVNASVLGRHDVTLEVYDGSLVADAKPVIFLNERVTMPGIDTTEEIPPLRFNGSPTSTVGGTTANVEIALETDEFSECKFSTASGTPYAAMTNTFANTGIIFHSTVVPVTPGETERFYIRCIDDEGNFNIDDYLIEFTVGEEPTGTANTEGSTSGDGTGSGDDGTGSGGGSGGTSGEADGVEPLEGGTSGAGGSGGGGGGGSGGSSGSRGGGGFEDDDGPFRSGDGRVIISGLAYPDAEVTILADGEIIDTVNANSTGVYSITIDEIARGTYTFGVYAEGDDGVRSSTFSTSFTVTGARTSALGNINIPPSINVDPNPANPGQTITVSGYALPEATVTAEIGPVDGSPTSRQVITDGSGAWSFTYDTAGLTTGTYQVRARAEQADGEDTESTEFSDYTFFGVGQEADVPGGNNSDLNRDGSVNLIDFSILLFWWGSDGGDSDPSADINSDGNVSLTDFSILLFNWTG